jgi:hypothetical protein
VKAENPTRCARCAAPLDAARYPVPVGGLLPGYRTYAVRFVDYVGYLEVLSLISFSWYWVSSPPRGTESFLPRASYASFGTSCPEYPSRVVSALSLVGDKLLSHTSGATSVVSHLEISRCNECCVSPRGATSVGSHLEVPLTSNPVLPRAASAPMYLERSLRSESSGWQ